MKCHTVYGYLLLKSMGYPPAVCEAVRDHHERYARTVHGRHCDNCEQMARAFECYVADNLE